MFVNNLDPVAFEFLSFQIRWYSLAYIFGFLIGWFYIKNFLTKDLREKTLVDDFITYLILGVIIGGTICRAADALRSQGAIEVHAACSHGLFTGGAVARLIRYVDGVHATSSLKNPRDVISGGPALARGVKELFETLGWK